ncbi:PAS domain-containing sensor histidine kinase [Gemmatimonadota bacterium]
MRRRNWPIALAVLFIAQLVWYLVYTGQIFQAVRANAEGMSQVYARVQEEINNPTPPDPVEALLSANQTLFELQGIIIESGVPLVLTGPGDTVLAAANLPFQADLSIPGDQARVRDYVRRLDEDHPPLEDPSENLIHFGEPPAVRSLRWIPGLQAAGLLLTALLAVLSVRVQRRAEGERAWTAMARELAHQLGTPLSSLQGWLELLRLPREDRPQGLGEEEIAREIEGDVSRLEGITHRFEIIGQAPELQEVDLSGVLSSLRQYLELRLPRLGSGIDLEVEVAPGLPPVSGNEVLLTWALENVVKNSLDALGGKGGIIRIHCREGKDGRILITISDTGPGVPPEIRDEIFDPGVTTKARGWGVGLALSRRIVEGVHGGRIELDADVGSGSTFVIRLPSAGAKKA